MARFKMSEADNYGGTSGGGYFSLKDDKEVARVRFLYTSADDVEGYAVHRVKVGDRERYVSCLRAYNEPVDNCPFCKAGMLQQAKLFVPLYNEDAREVQLWERGKTFFTKLASLCARYPNLVSNVFEVERNGKKGDMKTSYEIYSVDKDNSTIEDFPQAPNPIGTVVLDKTAEDMDYYIRHGEFPETGDRGSSFAMNAPTGGEEPLIRRRTPATRRDAF